MNGAETGQPTFDLGAGRLCLDFANTADWHRSARPEERLRSYADLLAWGRQAAALTAGEAERLLRAAQRRPADAADVLRRAVALREAIYRLFSALAAGRPPADADLAVLNAALAEALPRLRLAASEEGFVWTWAGDADALDAVLWPVARSAAELLTADERDRVRECADDNCGWLFLDMSRNRSRRWCSMEGCGNRAKARRYYARKKRAARQQRAARQAGSSPAGRPSTAGRTPQN